MLRIRLKKTFLYEIVNEYGMIEYHWRYTYLDIGYKRQICFMSIIQEDWCNLFAGATMLWHSKF
jgi:hypothetical protein